MDNDSFLELINRVASLPGYEQRLTNLNDKIYRAEEDVKSLLHKYQEEALDVDQIQKDSLSNTLLRMIGKYEGKLNREVQEMVTAKLEYDKALLKVQELIRERAELASRITGLKKDKQTFEEEYTVRENKIKALLSGQVYQKYIDIQSSQNHLAQQLVEIDEAVRAANKVVMLADDALEHLKKAEGWATYDVWGGKGIISHMAKYGHIDDAQAVMHKLGFLVDTLRKELSDISFEQVFTYNGIDSTTRAVDFWFDNIFTDLNVRDRIRNDSEGIRRLIDQTNRTINNLETVKNDINNKLREAEERKNELIIALE